MTKTRKILDGVIFSLQVIILVLFLFRSSLEAPVWLQPVGRMHPMLLHFPIAIGLFLWVLYAMRRSAGEHLYQLEAITLRIAAASTALTTFMGLLLAVESGYQTEAVDTHGLMGVLLSFSLWALIPIHGLRQQKKWYPVMLLVVTLLITVTGHLGAGITHGEDFIVAPLNQPKAIVITDETPFFEAAIVPILETKCKSCHRPGKTKGGLDLSSAVGLREGGEHGPVILPGTSDSSEMIRRIVLPVGHEDHMPPEGKGQVNDVQLKLLRYWIQLGANTQMAWKEVPDSLKSLVTSDRPISPVKIYAFDFADPDLVAELNTPYCTVQPLANGVPALKADFYVVREFKVESFLNLKKVAVQLVELNLANMPLPAKAFDQLAIFKNLERLNLTHTPCNDSAINGLQPLAKLKSISLSNTRVTYQGLTVLGSLPALREVFCWNCPVTDTEFIQLQQKFPQIQWFKGGGKEETLALTPPLAGNEGFLIPDGDSIRLRHNLRGTILRYTLDGTEPDSLAPIYRKPLPLDKYLILKARAFKSGWNASPTAVFHYFSDGFTPSRLVLLTAPSKEYASGGAKILIDHKMGDPGNFRDGGWLGYRHNPAEVLIELTDNQHLKRLTISFSQRIASYIMPPARVELWGSQNEKDWQVLQRVVPEQPGSYEPDVTMGVVLPVEQSFRFYKLKIVPVAVLPSWHSGKGDKGWVFLDELILE